MKSVTVETIIKLHDERVIEALELQGLGRISPSMGRLRGLITG